MIRHIPGSAPARVLLALLSRRNRDTLRCDPSIATIVADSGLTKSGVLRAMNQLEKAGLVERVASKGRRTAYRLITKTGLQSGTSPQNEASPQSEATTSPQSDTTLVHDPAPELVHDPTPEQTIEQTNELTTSTTDVADAEKVLRELGIDELTAKRLASEKPGIAIAWGSVSWEIDYPDIRNRAAFTIAQIRVGSMPTKRAGVRPGMRSYLERLRDEERIFDEMMSGSAPEQRRSPFKRAAEFLADVEGL